MLWNIKKKLFINIVKITCDGLTMNVSARIKPNTDIDLLRPNEAQI